MADQRHLVLHMDVNKTIIMVDPAGGKTVEDVVADIVAGSLVGRLQTNTFTAESVLLERHARATACSSTSDTMTFKDYLCDVLLPFAEHGADVSEDVRAEATRAVKQQRLAQVRGIMSQDSPHHIDGVRAAYDDLFTTLTAPERGLVQPAFFRLLEFLETEWAGEDIPVLLRAHHLTDTCFREVHCHSAHFWKRPGRGACRHSTPSASHADQDTRTVSTL